MTHTIAYCKHLKSASDLLTSYIDYRTGFVALALEKNRRATPFVDEARKLKEIASQYKTPMELLDKKEIRSAMLTAAGVSNKAEKFLKEQNKNDAILNLISKFLEPAGQAFVEELVYRFLLTKGDTLGGSMRNVGGALAQRKLTRSIISCLNIAGVPYHWTDKKLICWNEGLSSVGDADIEVNLRGISWVKGKNKRTLVYNINVPIVNNNNIDICLLETDYKSYCKDILAEPTKYIALGELKGGIDPAGADEHWKTARTALNRIHRGFDGHGPHTFFIGAAIEKNMSKEIWSMLEDKTISNAANLNNEKQLAAIVSWICSL